MNDCPTCGFPMTWSEHNERYWCSVYGYHRERFRTRNVLLSQSPISEVIRVDMRRLSTPNPTTIHRTYTQLSPSSTQGNPGTLDI